MQNTIPSPCDPPRVSLVLACRNEAANLERCLDSILRQQPPAGGLELIVADGRSEDGTRDILDRWQASVAGPWSTVNGSVIRVIDNPGRIAATGLNAALRAATGDFIIRLDAHTEYAPDYVRQCVTQMQTTGADNVGGPARTKPETYTERAIAAAYHSWFSAGGAKFHDIGFEGFVDTVTYGCWRRETFSRFGYFDEGLVRNQDDEHNLRIIRGGGKIWQSPQIRSWYRPRGSLRELIQQYLQYGYWKVRVIQKHQLPASWRHLVPGALLLTLLVLFLLCAGCFLLSLCSAFFGPVVGSPVVSSPWPVAPSVFHFCFLFSAFTLLLLSCVYFVAVLLASISTAAKTAWNLLPVLPVIFGCYHFSYGFGFLCGLWHFVIRHGNARTKFTLLTRRGVHQAPEQPCHHRAKGAET